MTAQARRTAERHGRRGETVAAWWLRLHGWRIIDRRVRTAVGEIDLIARRGRTIAFVEVKHRTRAAALDHAIDRQRLKRVAAAATLLAPRYAADADTIRIDVILVAPGRLPRHIANAWHG
ncbi:YraN family protein [Sphingomonas flavalba]|uniref:YraN family protein n=1 Tax=Sphingomonas flavalba TaxID=2559804 RepID=UPI0039E0025C